MQSAMLGANSDHWSTSKNAAGYIGELENTRCNHAEIMLPIVITVKSTLKNTEYTGELENIRL